MNIDQLQSKTIDYLRFPLAFFVVIIHAAGSPDINIQSIDFMALSGQDVYSIVSILVHRVMTAIGVPTFFVISGFLFFYRVENWNREVYARKLKSRVKTLIIPYLVWNAIVLFISAGRGLYIYFSTGEVTHILDQLTTFTGWLKPFWNQSHFGPVEGVFGNEFYLTYPYNGPFWFIRDLIMMCLISPLIYLIVRYTKAFGLLVLAGCLFTNFWFDIPGFSIDAFFYFTVGAYFSINKKNIVEQARKVKVPAAILALIGVFLSSYGTPESWGFTIPMRYCLLSYIIGGGITAINLTAWLLSKNKIHVNELLSKSSFMVFAAHGLTISALAPLFNYIRSDSVFSQIIQFFLFPMVVTAACVLAYYILIRYFPRLSLLLTGR